MDVDEIKSVLGKWLFVTSQEGSLNVSITDLMGREIWKSSHNVQDGIYIPFDLSFAAEGQYILKAELNGNVQFRRIQIIK